MSRTTPAGFHNQVFLANTALEIVRQAGAIATGELYQLFRGCQSQDSYNEMIATILETGLVEQQGHTLRWKTHNNN